MGILYVCIYPLLWFSGLHLKQSDQLLIKPPINAASVWELTKDQLKSHYRFYRSVLTERWNLQLLVSVSCSFTPELLSVAVRNTWYEEQFDDWWSSSIKGSSLSWLFPVLHVAVEPFTHLDRCWLKLKAAGLRSGCLLLCLQISCSEIYLFLFETEDILHRCILTLLHMNYRSEMAQLA